MPSDGNTQFLPNRLFSCREQIKCTVWYLASWNVRTLLDVEGSIQTARQGREVSVDERKIDQVVRELGWYKVFVAALQEMKWFGREQCLLTTSSARQRDEGMSKCCQVWL